MANEKRLVDVNALLEKMKNTSRYFDIKFDIEEAPTVDAVAVVRCKDCKHYRNHPHGLCYAWTEPCTNERGYKGEVHCTEPDDFCSYGERKDNDD